MNYSERLPRAGTDLPRPNYPKTSIVSYAQNREDVLLWRALHDVDGGYYVDVGAHDPESLSVTRAFYDKGWSGLNIEPDPHYAEKLRSARARDTTLQVALGRTAGRATLFDFGRHGLSTVQPDIAIDSQVAGIEVARHEVEVRTLADVLRDAGNPAVNFLKIDAEGAEADILAGADFTAVRPWIVLVEAIRPVTLEPSHGAWEHVLLDADYVFAYFDGLNRYYVAREHDALLAAFAVPVSINDPFEDAGIKRRDEQLATLQARGAAAGVGARTEGATAEQAPRLAFAAEVPVASRVDDATGLLQVVDAQAVELGRLRRALVAARALGDERLAILRGRSSEPGSAPAAPEAWPPGDLEALQSAVRKVEADIADILHRSRWRRLGLKLGVAKQAPWESTGWAPDPELLRSAATTTRLAGMRLRDEYLRLIRHRDDLGRSRWRKLGQRLGLAKRLPWEVAPEPIAATAIGSEARPTASPPSTVDPPSLTTGYEGFVEYATRSFLGECQRAAVDVIIDVGANSGQFASGLRASGYAGPIVSFEPLRDAHAALVERARDDVLWTVAPRCAVGATEGEATIHVAGNSYSSSLLPMLESHRSAAPESEYVDSETCPVTTLDGVIARMFSDSTTSFGLKMDTQGFEAEVLKGLVHRNRQVQVIICEMSLTPLYEGAPTFFELCERIAALGFRCVALGPEFADPRTGLLLQVNGVFARDPRADAAIA